MKKESILLLCLTVIMLSVTCEKKPPLSPPDSISANTGGSSHRIDTQSYDWTVSTPEEQGMDAGIVNQTIRIIQERIPFMTSFLVVKNGYLVVEEYFRGYEREDIQPFGVIGLPFLSALVGVALEQGIIPSIDHKIMDFLPEYATEDLSYNRYDVTVRHLLSMTSGIQSTTNAFWNSRNYTQWAIEEGFQQRYDGSDIEPGERWEWSLAATHLLSTVLTKASFMSTLEFASAYLCDPLSISIGHWVRAPEGYYFGDWGMSFTPRNLARFGQLYLDNGVAGGQQLISTQFITESYQNIFGAMYPDYTESAQNIEMRNWGYGYLWNSGKINGFDTYSGLEGTGRFFILIPDLDMIIVTTVTSDQGDLIMLLISHYLLSAVYGDHEPPPYRPIHARASKLENESLFQSEWINYIQWEPNPLNAGDNITSYKIYWLNRGERILLGETGGDNHEFWHRGPQITPMNHFTYGISTVINNDRESISTIVSAQ